MAHVEVRSANGFFKVEADLKIDGTPSTSFTGICKSPTCVEWYVDGYTLGDPTITITAASTSSETTGVDVTPSSCGGGWSRTVDEGTGTLSAAGVC